MTIELKILFFLNISSVKCIVIVIVISGSIKKSLNLIKNYKKKLAKINHKNHLLI